MITLTFAAILLIAVLAHRAGRPMTAGPDGATRLLVRFLDSRSAVCVVFVASFLVMWRAWAAMDPLPVIHDEMAYVLQAQIFARGAWTLPSPALPAFWEQPYILLQPVIASKYFPGHSLVLSLGAMVGWMALVPLTLQAVSGSLVFVLGRRVASGGVAILAWVLWISSPIVLYFGPSFYSETMTTVCWLAGWYALLRWRTTHWLPWLMAVAFFVGWCVISRPLTGVAYAIPIAVLLMRDAIRDRRWPHLGFAILVGACVLSIIPLWSARTTGDWRVTPLLRYTREYMPYDLPGFGLNETPPSRMLTPEMSRLSGAFARAHIGHVPAALPHTLWLRSFHLWESTWGSSSGAMSVFALLGLLALTPCIAFAVASSATLMLVYLSFATPSSWVLYYFEATPALALLTALGLAWAVSQAGRPRSVPSTTTYRWSSPRYSEALVAGAMLLAVPGGFAVERIRAAHIVERGPLGAFRQTLGRLPAGKSIVFVRYAANHDPHVTFVRNVIEPRREPVWVVYDRGEPDNADLLDLAADRKGYLFDEAQGRIYPYNPHSVP